MAKRFAHAISGHFLTNGKRRSVYYWVLYNNPSYSRILFGSRLWSIRGQMQDWRQHYKVFPSAVLKWRKVCSYHILTSYVIYNWTDAQQHGIYLLNRQRPSEHLIKDMWLWIISGRISLTSLHTATVPAVRSLMKTELSTHGNETIIVVSIAVNKNKDNAQVALGSSYNDVTRKSRV